MKNDFVDLTRQVWETVGVEEKRKLMYKMIEDFAVKNVGKFAIHELRFRYAVQKAKTSTELDRLASNIMLSKGEKVI